MMSRLVHSTPVLIAALLGLSALVYMNSLAGSFVYDDVHQIVKNPRVRSLANLRTAFSTNVWDFYTKDTGIQGGYYRPLFTVWITLFYQCFGLKAGFWHLGSLAVHLGVTVAVFFMARLFVEEKAWAFGAALLFGLHPIHVESVAWISGVTDPGMSLFVLVSFLLYRASIPTRSRLYGVVPVACFALALLCKETALGFTVFLVVYEVLDPRAEQGARGLKGSLFRLLPYVLTGLVYLAVRYQVLGFMATYHEEWDALPHGTRLTILAWLLLRYLVMAVAPSGFSIWYGEPSNLSVLGAAFVLPVVLLALLAAAAVRWGRTSRNLWLLASWFVIFLLPALHVRAFPIGSVLHDRNLYLPSVAACIGTAALLSRGSTLIKARLERAPASRVMQALRAAPAAALALMALWYGMSTAARNRDFRDEPSLYFAAYARSPNNPFAAAAAGAMHARMGNFIQARVLLERALEEDSRNQNALAELAALYASRGIERQKAILFARKAVEIQPDIKNRRLLAEVLLATGELEQAEAVARKLVAASAGQEDRALLSRILKARKRSGG